MDDNSERSREIERKPRPRGGGFLCDLRILSSELLLSDGEFLHRANAILIDNRQQSSGPCQMTRRLNSRRIRMCRPRRAVQEDSRTFLLLPSRPRQRFHRSHCRRCRRFLLGESTASFRVGRLVLTRACWLVPEADKELCVDTLGTFDFLVQGEVVVQKGSQAGLLPLC